MGLVTVRDVNEVQYDIPDGSRITLQGLDIIGDGATDWNEPIQKNLVHLSNEQIKGKTELETSIGLKADRSYVDTQLATKSEFSGSYDDLTNKPSIQSVPTNVSSFTNDAGYLKPSDYASADISALNI